MKSKVGKKEKRQAVFRKAIAIVASVAMLTLVIPASFASNVASSTAGTPESAIASVEVSLDLGNGYIVYDGQTVAAPSTAITVPEGKDLVFSASADTGYDLNAVKMGLNGSTSELTRIADGTYTVGASNVEHGLSITLVTTAQQSAAPSSTTVDITQSESQATQAENTKTVYTYEDESVTVTATLQDANAIPDGAIFKVTPVTKETQGYNYDAYMTALNDQDKSSGETHNDQNTLLYDIAFMYLGKEYEPASGSVKVDIQFKNSQLTNGIGTQSSQDVSVSHLALSDAKKDSVATTKDATNISSADINVETLAAEASIEGQQTTSFTADSFSVFSISSVGPTMAWQGTEALTSDRLIGGVGRANDYAVFAENLTNTDHIEGNVATDNYYVGGGSASFDQLDNIYKQNILSGITVIKRVEGGLADGTFTFGIYGIYDGKYTQLSTHQVTTSGGTGQTYVDVQANDKLKKAALNGALYVYELDGDKPLHTNDENGDGSYSVRYETLDGSTEVAGSQFSSARLSNYVGKVFLTDGNVNSSMNLNDIKGHVLAGNNNSLVVNYGDHPLGGAIELGEPYESTWGGQNRNDLVVHAQNGTWYINKEARAESPADYVKPVTNQTMVREYLDTVLKPFSAALARANSSKEGTSNGDAGGTTYVINIDGKSGSLASSLSAAGYTHVNDGNGFISGFSDGDFVVVNIDCTGMDKFDIDNFIIDGKQSSGDYNNYFANHIIFNPVEKDASGNYVAYSGTVNLTGNYSGIMFAPGATIKIGNVLCGQLIGETVIRGGSEIHKKTMTDSTAIEHSAEVTIVNSKAGVSGNLTITKAFGEGSFIDAANLSDTQKAAISFTVTGPNDYSRTFTYADMQNGSITLANLAVGDYTVTESAQGSVTAGYTLAVEGNGSTAHVAADATAQVALTNTYSYNANGSAHIDVQKSYAGTYPQGGFGFTLTGVDGAPLPGGAQAATVNVSNGDKASFGDIAFNISDIADGLVLNGRLTKEFTYTVSENLPDGVTAASPTKDGITYDTAAHTVKVMVWDKGDGTLGTAVDYGTQGADALNISNSYAAQGHVDFTGTKTLVGHALDADIAAGFTYEILDEQGNRVGLGTTNANGAISYDSINYYLNADKNDVGQHSYTVREIMPEGLSYDEATGKWAGSSCYLYDGTNHTVVVDVADGGNGTLSATVVSVDGNSTLKTLDFENAYRASGSATITATKELLGRDLKAGEFSFDLKDASGRVLQTVQNDEHGAVTFKPIQYSLSDLEKATRAADGSYEFAYTISEKAGSAGGVTYSDASVNVTVKVTDDGNGTLSAVVGYASERGAVFTNTYSAQGATSVDVTKDYNNWANAQTGFDFTITAEEGTPLPEKTTVTATQQNKTPSFGTIAFTTADLQGGALVNGKLTKSFSYVISEVAPAAVYNGVTYDTKPRVLTITATDNGDGTITCTQSVTKDGSTSDLSFTNTYDARGSVTLQGLKGMEGRNLTADDSFSFTITPTDQGGNPIEGAQTFQASSSGANGVISYPQIFYTLGDMANADGSYASSKIFYYTVTENIPDDATITTASGETVAYKDATDDQKKAGGFSKNGVTYSTAPQKFTVTVTDTGIGVLSAEAKLVDNVSAGANTLSAASSNAGGNEASRSSSGLARFATNLNGNYDSTVTTTISGEAVPQQTGKTFDIVFVVDTSASQGDTAEALMNKMLAEAEAGGYKVNIGIVKYYYVAKVVRNLDGSAGWDGSGKTNGTNLPAGILLGTKMLDDDTSVADENKYLVVLSDGDTYIYQDNNELNAYKDSKGVLRTVGDDAMVVTQMDSDYTNVPFAGPGSYSWKYFNGNKEPESFAPPANWDQFFATVAPQVQADNGAYETKWDWHTNNLYSGTTNAIPENEVANHAVSADTSLYYSLIDYRAAAAKYHTYATFVYGGYNRPYGESFMAYLNGGESFDMTKLEEQLLSDIKGAVNGGEIVDTIGSGYDNHGNAYDMDFVNSIDTTDIVFNGVTLDKRTNADGTFSFGTNDGGVFNELFKFTYTPAIEANGNETASDSYTVTFSNAVSSTDTIQLRYNVHLSNPQTASGTYGNYDADGSKNIEGLLVSSNAVLNRGGSSKTFANPVVSYSALGFVNTYNASGSADLLGTKAMEGRTFKSGDRFTFTVTADDGGVLPTKPSVTLDGASLNDQSSAALEFGSFTFGLSDAGKTYHYTITETGSAAGVALAAPQQVTVAVGQDTGTGVLDVSVTPNMGGLSFVNTYEANAELTFAGTKRMEGRAIADSDRFTFDISEGGQVIATATSAGSTITYPTLSYTLDDVGTHTYSVSEQAYNAAGVTSDTRSYEVNVDVADNGDGTLKVTSSDNAKALDFVNTYTSTGSIAINGTKSMVGRAFAQGDSFTFTLSGLDGAPLPAQTSTTITPTAGTSASFAFDAIEYTQANAGQTYTYEVRETPGNDAALSYDASVKTVRVFVEDDGFGNVKPRIVSESSDAVAFTNTYSASGSIVLSAHKELAGRALAAGEFSFELKDASGKVLQTKTNAADGSVSFDAIGYTLDDLVANADGTYSPAEKTYTISEVAGSDANIAYDAHSETVRVALSDAGNGTIVASADKTGLAVTFNNRVEDVTISGTKSWNDAASANAPRPSSITVNLLANGVEIDEQHVTAANNWSYSFTGLPRYAADGAEIAYTVTEDAVAGYVSAVDGSNITNTPIEKGEIRFAGTKSFAGQDDGQFTFTVRENGATVATGANKADGSIEFTPIAYSYRDVGRHVYTVTEDNAGQTIDGVTYDAVSYEVTVDVAVDGSRLVITPSSNYNALSFVNTYAAQGSMTFKGVKRIEGRAMTAADVYGFTVSEIGTTNTWAASNAASAGAESGAIAYPTIEYTLADVGEHSYMVTENAPVQGGVTVQTMGYKVTVSVTDNGDGTLAVTPTRESADPNKLDFTNLYTATGSITFAGTKTLTGRALTADDTFVFDVKDTTPGSAGKTLNATNSGATINYPTINYTQADVGRHTYTVTERSMATGGVKSSGQSYDVTVDVTDNGDGTLGIVASDNARSLDFVNTYEASGSTELTGYKSIEGRSFSSGDSATLTVSAPAGTPMPPTTQLDINPTSSTSVPVDFGKIEYSVENAGQTYVYTVSETVNGMAGTQTAVDQTVTVTVTDKGDGELAVAKTSNSGENFNLVNVYNATGSATLSATKSLTGRDWGAAESFSFALAAVDGAPMPAAGGETATASSAARTADFGVINYTLADAGKTYTYAITENVPAGVTASSPTLNGVTYDLSTHTVSVTVTDNGNGTLSTQVVYDGAYSTAPVFSNVYTTTEATAHLNARKSLTGAALQGGEFSFTLAGTSSNAASTQMVASNAADGSVTFGNLVFTEPGTYEYRISENAGNDAAYTYDSNVHSATVVVDDNGLGQLVVTSITYDGNNASEPTFTNTYFEAKASLAFTKYYFGSLAASFEFKLVETDANWRALTGDRAYTETVTNGAFNADGVASVEFSELAYHEPGDHYYTVQESKQDGFVTDDVVYRVHVNVGDDMTVTRTCQMLYDGETYDIDFADANFYNNNAVSLGFMALSAMSAGPAGAATDVYPRVRKTLDGTTSALHDGEFSFLLSDENGNVVAIGTNDANGQVAFFEEGEAGLWFTANDVGTHKYTITELNDDISGMNFDTKTIGYTVTVTQNGDGSLSTTEVYDVNGVEVDDPTFENTTEGINVRVQKVSRMGGEGLDVCTYGLWLANADGADVLIQEATSDATGWIVFDNARLKQGELYYFKEVEAPTGHKVDPYRSAYVTLDPTGSYLVLAENTVDGLHAAGNEGE